jgi:hypothetical protein
LFFLGDKDRNIDLNGQSADAALVDVINTRGQHDSQLCGAACIHGFEGWLNVQMMSIMPPLGCSCTLIS